MRKLDTSLRIFDPNSFGYNQRRGITLSDIVKLSGQVKSADSSFLLLILVGMGYFWYKKRKGSDKNGK